MEGFKISNVYIVSKALRNTNIETRGLQGLGESSVLVCTSHPLFSSVPHRPPAPAPPLPKSLGPCTLSHPARSQLGDTLTLITCLHEALNYRVLILHDSSLGGCIHKN